MERTEPSRTGVGGAVVPVVAVAVSLAPGDDRLATPKKALADFAVTRLAVGLGWILAATPRCDAIVIRARIAVAAIPLDAQIGQANAVLAFAQVVARELALSTRSSVELGRVGAESDAAIQRVAAYVVGALLIVVTGGWYILSRHEVIAIRDDGVAGTPKAFAGLALTRRAVGPVCDFADAAEPRLCSAIARAGVGGAQARHPAVGLLA